MLDFVVFCLCSLLRPCQSQHCSHLKSKTKQPAQSTTSTKTSTNLEKVENQKQKYQEVCRQARSTPTSKSTCSENSTVQSWPRTKGWIKPNNPGKWEAETGAWVSLTMKRVWDLWGTRLRNRRCICKEWEDSLRAWFKNLFTMVWCVQLPKL